MEGRTIFSPSPSTRGTNARAKTVLRRKTGDYNKTITLAGCSSNWTKRIVLADSKPRASDQKEFEILIFLVPIKQVSHQSIAERSWGDYMEDAISLFYLRPYQKAEKLVSRLQRLL